MPFRFNQGTFLTDTVLPVSGDNADYVRRSSVPLLSETLPVLDFDNSERFTHHSCQLGYTAINGRTEAVSLVFETDEKLPRKVATDLFRLPGGDRFDGIAIGRRGIHLVAGLREFESQQWQVVSADRVTLSGIFSVIKAKTYNPIYRNDRDSLSVSVSAGQA